MPALEARLRARVSSPRLQMSLMVALTAGAGFLASVLLNAAGMEAMWLRYPLCVALAYAVFLLQIAVWRRWREYLASPRRTACRYAGTLLRA